MISKILTNFLSAFLLLAGSAIPASAAVTNWRADKGRDYLQTADNTQPSTPTNWYFYSDLETDLTGDATNVVITGGNIPGSMAFVNDGTFWELYVDYPSKAALDTVFPSSSSYSIILSGGTMGTVTQQFSIATDDYPPVPYLSGADYSTFQTLDVFEPFEVNWALPTQSISSVGFEITEGTFLGIGNTVVDLFPGNIFTNAFLASDFFVAGSNYSGYLQFSISTNANGAGGFDVDGITAFNTEAVFPISAVNASAMYDDFNDGSMDTNKWNLTFPPEIAADTFTETNSHLEYISAGTGDTFIAWTWDAGALSYTQDWSIAMDVTDTIPANAFSGDEETYFGFLVMADGDLDNNISVEFVNDGGGRAVATYASSGGTEVLSNSFDQVSTETIAIKLSFDADTKMLHTAYSTGGDYIVQTNFSATGWGMTDSSVFNPAVFSGSDFFEVTNGQVYADNFRIYDGNALSNEVEFVELEFLHSYGDGSIFTEINEIKIDADTSHRITGINVITSGGDAFIVPLDGVEGATNFWDVDVAFPFAQPWNPANDGNWTVTFGFNNGTFQSTVIPFTLPDGITPIPNFYNKPMFISPSPANGLVTASNSFSFAWLPAVSNAIYVSVDEIVNGNEIGDIELTFSDGLPGDTEIIAGVTIDGPLSTTNYGPIVFGQGFHRMRINEGNGHAAYNDEGVAYIVVKQNESDIIFTITDDVDGDNMPDDWETTFFGGTNVVNGGALDDFDNDGMLNVEEYIAGVNPTNSSSVFAVEDPGPSPAGFVINWNSVEGRKYGVYWAKTLSDPFVSVTPGYISHPQNSYTDTVHTNQGCGFYYIDVQLDN